MLLLDTERPLVDMKPALQNALNMKNVDFVFFKVDEDDTSCIDIV